MNKKQNERGTLLFMVMTMVALMMLIFAMKQMDEDKYQAAMQTADYGEVIVIDTD